METEEPHTSGWSEVMTRILQGNVKSNILSKAKKDRDITFEKRKIDDPEEEGVEIVDEEGNTRRIEGSDESEEEELPKKQSKKTKRIKPERRSTWDRESELNALATKGVVQLFNAVNQHRQLVTKSLESTGKSERKRDKTLSKFSTDSFMEVLKGGEEKTVAKKKRFQDVLSEDVDGTRIEEWESDSNSN